MRATAKTVNFGVIYGISPFGLAKQLRIEQNVAKEFIDAYFVRYPKVRQYMDTQIAFARQHGYVTTLFRRRRYLPEIQSKDNAIRQFAERMAINTPVQGTAADLIKLAMVNLAQRLRQERLESRLLIQVHDELVLECSSAELKPLTALVRHEMTQALSLKVPIEVSVKAGKNWLDMEPV
jgi:DNA polymerase-1